MDLEYYEDEIHAIRIYDDKEMSHYDKTLTINNVIEGLKRLLKSGDY